MLAHAMTLATTTIPSLCSTRTGRLDLLVGVRAQHQRDDGQDYRAHHERPDRTDQRPGSLFGLRWTAVSGRVVAGLTLLLTGLARPSPLRLPSLVRPLRADRPRVRASGSRVWRGLAGRFWRLFLTWLALAAWLRSHRPRPLVMRGIRLAIMADHDRPVQHETHVERG